MNPTHETTTTIPEHPNLTPLHWKDYVVWFIVALAAIALIGLLAHVLLPFIAAALAAYMVEPVVQWLVRRRIGRAFSALLILAMMVMIGMGLILLLLPLILEEIVPLLYRVPEMPKKLVALLHQYFPQVAWESYLNIEALRAYLTDHQSTIENILQTLKNTLLKSGGSVMAMLANVLLFPVALFYFIVAWPTFSQNLQSLLPPKFRQWSLSTLSEIDRVLAEYMHGQMLVVIALAIFYALSLTLTGLPHGFSLGVLTGLFVLIPYLGYVIGFSLSLLMVLLSGDSSIFGWVVLVFLIGQLLESYLLTPFLVGERIGLHPLAVIFALLAFGQLLGFAGVLLALPASAILLVLLRALFRAYRDSRFYQLS